MIEDLCFTVEGLTHWFYGLIGFALGWLITNLFRDTVEG